jgi:hypothetical protein
VVLTDDTRSQAAAVAVLCFSDQWTRSLARKKGEAYNTVQTVRMILAQWYLSDYYSSASRYMYWLAASPATMGEAPATCKYPAGKRALGQADEAEVVAGLKGV